MKKIKAVVKKGVAKYGAAIAACAFAFVTIAANSSCMIPFYEVSEPESVARFKKTDRWQ